MKHDLRVIGLLDGLYTGRLVSASDTSGYMPGGGRRPAGSVRIVTVSGDELLQFPRLRDR